MSIKNDFRKPYQDEIGTICQAIEFARICGVDVSGVLVNIAPTTAPSSVMLCVYVDLANRTLKDDCKMPVFPMFANHEVAQEMLARGIFDIVAENRQGEISRWWVKFAPSFI